MPTKWSLRAMLLAIVGCSVAFALLYNYRYQPTSEEIVLSAGAELLSISVDGSPPIQIVHLQGTEITSELIRQMAQLDPPVEDLVLTNCTIMPGALDRLERLTKLRYLDLSYSNVVDAELTALPRLTWLKGLNLSATPIGDAALVGLNANVNLTHVDLARTKVTDATARVLARLPRLVSVDLAMTEVGDDGAAALLQGPWLERINLADTLITDRAFAALPPGGKLIDVAVHATGVGDETVKRLAALPQLRELLIHGTSATPAGVAAAVEAPGLECLTVHARSLSPELRQRAAARKIELVVCDEIQPGAAIAALQWTLDGYRRRPPESFEVQRKALHEGGIHSSSTHDNQHFPTTDVHNRLFELIDLMKSH